MLFFYHYSLSVFLNRYKIDKNTCKNILFLKIVNIKKIFLNYEFKSRWLNRTYDGIMN